MPVEAVVRDVELAADEPLGVGRLPLQHRVPGLEPVELFGPPGPECLGVVLRTVIDRRIGEHRPLPESLGGWEPAIFV